MRILHNVDPDKIMVPEVRVTSQFDEETDAQFKKSVKGTGIEDPIVCYQVEDKLVLSDGLHRLNEAKDNGMKVDVVVRPGDMITVLCRNLMSGHLRGKHPVSQMVNVIEALWKEYGLDSEKIAAKTGMTRDYVEKLQQISLLTPLGRLALDEQRIKIGHAEALATVQDPVRQETLLGQLELYHWPVAEFKEHVKEVNRIVAEPEPEPGEAPPRERSKVKCFFCGEEHDVSEIANPNTCTSCAGITLQSIAMARAELAREAESQKDTEGV